MKYRIKHQIVLDKEPIINTRMRIWSRQLHRRTEEGPMSTEIIAGRIDYELPRWFDIGVPFEVEILMDDEWIPLKEI
jgi:hypothetical protein